jgi:hypothetical protein
MTEEATAMKATERILGAKKLTEVFGSWPSFHDAEVVWVRLDRRPFGEGYGPTAEALIHTFEMTSEVGSDGFFVLRNHVLVHVRFHGVVELQLAGFNHQNAIFGLSITDLCERQYEHIHFQVEIDPAHGIEASFQCREIEIVSVVPCDRDGSPAEA